MKMFHADLRTETIVKPL